MARVASWGAMNETGDWVIEERYHYQGELLGCFLCIMQRGGEQQIRLTEDLVEILHKAGVPFVRSAGFGQP